MMTAAATRRYSAGDQRRLQSRPRFMLALANGQCLRVASRDCDGLALQCRVQIARDLSNSQAMEQAPAEAVGFTDTDLKSGYALAERRVSGSVGKVSCWFGSR